MRDTLVTVQHRIFRRELDTRLAEIETCRRRDFPRVLQLAQEALAYAEPLGDLSAYVRAMLFSAWGSANLNQVEDALTMACEGLVLARNYRFRDQEIFALDILGMAFALIGATEESLQVFRHMNVLAEDYGDPELIFMARHDLGVTLLNTQDPESALPIMDKAFQDIPPEIANTPDSWQWYSNVCHMYAQFQQTEKAVYYGELGLRQAQLLDNRWEAILTACTALASAYTMRGEFTQAELYLHQARRVALEDPTGRHTGNLLVAEAVLYASSGRLADATAIAERAYTFALEHNMIQNAEGHLHLLRQLYTDLDDKDQLLEVYRRLTEDIPRFQQQSNELRLKILRMVFAADKAAIRAELNLSQQKNAVMEQVSQKFRTPLDTIQTEAETLTVAKLSDQQRVQSLNKISAQVKTMRVVLDDIVDLLQPDDIIRPTDGPEMVSLIDLADVVRDDVKRYGMDSTRIVTHLPAKPVHVTCRLRPVRIALTHVVNNALKFSQSQVDFSLSLNADTLVAVVQDTGVGIPQAEIQSVFQPLYRASNNLDTTGYGIGLPLAAKEVAAVNGDINIESDTGAGTTVTIRVPVQHMVV